MPSPLDAARFLIFRIPLVLKTALFHLLKLSPTSTKWDLRTALTVTIIRDVLCNSPPSTISMQQRSTIQDPGVKGRMWVSRATIPAPPEGAIRDVLTQAIRALGTGDEEYLTPALAPVTAEWTGYRASVPHNAPEPSISEADKYKCLMEETTTDVTLLYFHGGSYYLMDPCSHREVVASYAKLTGGRVLSVRYRLAPQNPFPSALLDALVVYLSLLYPPEGALHSPVPPSHIVFGGDSAGGNLATVLLQTILQLHRGTPDGDSPVVIFHGKPVKVPLPAGIALGSPSLDITRSMQSSKTHAQYDYLPPPSINPANSPPCNIWPANPPRADLFCEGSALCHPLVSPVAAPSWRGSPPIFVSCGEELLTDECKVFAQKAARQGVTVVWEQYEAMPHCFAHILQGTLTSSQSLESYASFVTRAVQNPSEITTKGTFFAAKSLESSSVDVCNLNDTSEEDVLEGLKHAQDKIVRNFSSLNSRL
jgi:acetyl esterase/lipase